MSKTGPPIRAKPPTRENVTEVAYDVKRCWDQPGRYYCPNVCYKIEDGRMRLLQTFEQPDDNSDTKLLCSVDKSPGNKMSEYRTTIYEALRARGVA